MAALADGIKRRKRMKSGKSVEIRPGDRSAGMCAIDSTALGQWLIAAVIGSRSNSWSTCGLGKRMRSVAGPVGNGPGGAHCWSSSSDAETCKPSPSDAIIMAIDLGDVLPWCMPGMAPDPISPNTQALAMPVANVKNQTNSITAAMTRWPGSRTRNFICVSELSPDREAPV